MYKLTKRKGKIKSDSIIELSGYETKINKLNITIYNQKIIDILILKKLLPEFERLVKQILLFLSESDDPSGAEYLLDELSRVYTMYLNKYEKYLSNSEKKSFMKKIHLLSNELKKIARNKKMAMPSIGRRVR